MPDVAVLADRDLLSALLSTLLTGCDAAACRVRVAAESRDGVVQFTLRFHGDPLPDPDVFAVSKGQIPYLLAKQIIREHDAYSGMPGLRLQVANNADGYTILFTLKEAGSKGGASLCCR